MMEFERELEIFRSRKREIIGRWLDMMKESFPEYYSESSPTVQVELYFDCTMDLHIPLELHALHEKLPEMSRSLVERGIPFSHIFRSCSYWRAAVFEISREPGFGTSAHTVQFLNSMTQRIEQIQELICSHYMERTSSMLQDKERALTQLHDDRLNLIGKMAASMAHEIRNPLTSIKGFLKLIRESLSGDASDRTGRYLSVVENEFENINMQITGFLSFSKKRVIEEPFLRVTVRQLLDSVISLLNPRFLSENVNLTVNILDQAALEVQKVSVQQVISNVINNGLDALEEVRSEKEMHISGYSTGNQYVLKISNNGPEVNPRILGALFEPFVTDKVEGTGLGLAVCKTIMQKNGGDIGCVTGPERTTFILTFQKEREETEGLSSAVAEGSV